MGKLKDQLIDKMNDGPVGQLPAITEEVILDTIDNLIERTKAGGLSEESQLIVRLYLSQMGLELRRKLNDN